MKKLPDKILGKLATVLPADMLEAVLPFVLVVLVALAVAYKYVDPAPPKKIVISAGSREGNYDAYARIYRELLKAENISLDLRDSEGSVENLHRLQNPDSGVDLAFIQGGVASTEPTAGLVSLGSLYYEPLWIFCKCKEDVTHLSALKGKRIAVGKEGGGTKVLAMTLLDASGINAGNATLVPIGDTDAAKAIQQGDVDVAFFVDTPTSMLIQNVAMDPSLRLISLDEAEAYISQFSYLHHLVLPAGALSIEKNIPLHDVQLLAPTATLVARESVHPALIYLMLKVISQVHGGAGLLQAKREFPSEKDTDFTLSNQAEAFYKSGLPFLDKYLPFWAATFVNRMFIVIIPLLVVLYPLTKIAPSLYTWLIKSKLYKCYGELRFLETQLLERSADMDFGKFADELDEIEKKVNRLRMPVAFSQHLYELKGHVELVRAKLTRLRVG